MSLLILGIALLLAVGLLTIGQRTGRREYQIAAAVAVLIGVGAAFIARPAKDSPLRSSGELLVDYLEAEVDAKDLLVLHTPDHPLLPPVRRAFRKATIKLVTNVFNAADLVTHPFSIREATVLDACRAHPEHDVLVLLAALPSQFAEWKLPSQRIVLGNGDPAWLDRYPATVEAVVHPLPPPDRGWTLTVRKPEP